MRRQGRECGRAAAGQGVAWLGTLALLAACAGDTGPVGPAGPPGECLCGATQAARFDRAEDVDTWLYGADGTWEVRDGRLQVGAAAGEQMTVGPSTPFAGDIDIAVEAGWVSAGADAACGVRFGVGEGGAYQFAIAPDGTFALRREGAAGSLPVPLLDWTASARLGGAPPVGLRLTRQGARLRLYIGGALVGEATDSALGEGYVQVFVSGPAEVVFDNLVVGATLPLR